MCYLITNDKLYKDEKIAVNFEQYIDFIYFKCIHHIRIHFI